MPFLMGLNDTYAYVRDQILLLDFISPINKVFAMVQQQEKPHQIIGIMRGSEGLVMATQSNTSKPAGKKDRQLHEGPCC